MDRDHTPSASRTSTSFSRSGGSTSSFAHASQTLRPLRTRLPKSWNHQPSRHRQTRLPRSRRLLFLPLRQHYLPRRPTSRRRFTTHRSLLASTPLRFLQAPSRATTRCPLSGRQDISPTLRHNCGALRRPRAASPCLLSSSETASASPPSNRAGPATA
jgi:hypothetical protein